MPTPTSPPSILDAVNVLLVAARVTQVMSIDDDIQNEDVAGALAAINNATRDVQLQGFEFNTDYNLQIDPGPTGEVVLPENVLKVISARTVALGSKLVARGLRLYSPDKHTFKIGEPAVVDMTVCLPFEDLPENFKRWAIGIAARSFALPKLPDGATFQYTAEYVEAAMKRCMSEDQQASEGDLSETSPHFANMRKR